MSNLPFCYDENIIFDPSPSSSSHPPQHHQQQNTLPLPPPPVIPRFDPFPPTAGNSNTNTTANNNINNPGVRFEQPPLLRFDLPSNTTATHRFESPPVPTTSNITIANNRYDPTITNAPQTTTSRFDPSNSNSTLPITIPRWEPHTLTTLDDPPQPPQTAHITASSPQNTHRIMTMSSSTASPAYLHNQTHTQHQHRSTVPPTMNAILDSICSPLPGNGNSSTSVGNGYNAMGVARNKSGSRKPRRQRKRPPGWTPMPREQRVYKECTKCHWKNHVRRLCCEKCFTSKSDMKKNSSSKAANISESRRSIANGISNSHSHSLLSSPELHNSHTQSYHHSNGNSNSNGHSSSHNAHHRLS